MQVLHQVFDHLNEGANLSSIPAAIFGCCKASCKAGCASMKTERSIVRGKDRLISFDVKERVFHQSPDSPGYSVKYVGWPSLVSLGFGVKC